MNVLPEDFRKLSYMKGDECVHLVTHGHFRSHDKDGGHSIRSAVIENPMLYTNLIALLGQLYLL